MRALDADARIVFLTAHENYARHGYKVRAYDYLLKDSYQEELFSVLARIRKEERENKEDYFMVSSDKKEYKFHLNDILYLNKEGQYTVFHCQGDVLYKERGALQNVLERLPEDRFMLIDKGTIINLKHIVQFEKCVLTLASGEALSVSRRLRPAVQKKLLDYWGEIC